jgi:hypothetical protein
MPPRASKPPHPERPPKRPRDINQLAFQIVQEATGQAPARRLEWEEPIQAAAAVMGRKGGLKGGKKRAASLSPERRREIAEKAAAARWGKTKSR